MYKIGEEEMVICPYDCHHVVSKLRIQKHIIKCRKNNPDVKLATCFYNYSHRLKLEDLLAHYEICSHKTRVDGARYSEPACRPPAAGTSDFPQRKFPDINIKTQFLCDSPFFFSNLTQKCNEDGQRFETSGSDSENENFQLKPNEKIGVEESNDYADDQDDSNNYDDADNDELEPLPLPKTVSKAFVYSKQQVIRSTIMPSQSRQFGRGKSLLAFSPPRESRTTDHLLPDLSDMENNLPKREKSSKFFLKNSLSSCNLSVVSSMFDDTTTLKSEEIIFDEESDEDEESGFILKNFDKYTKI